VNGYKFSNTPRLHQLLAGMNCPSPQRRILPIADQGSELCSPTDRAGAAAISLRSAEFVYVGTGVKVGQANKIVGWYKLRNGK